MRLTIDHRNGGTVMATWPLDEFRGFVEWLELVDPSDGATKDLAAWRDEHAPVDAADDEDQDAARFDGLEATARDHCAPVPNQSEPA